MKQLLFLILSISIYNRATSQIPPYDFDLAFNEFYYSDNEKTAFNKAERLSIMDANIKTEKIYKTLKKGEVLQSEHTYNKEGAIINTTMKKHNRDKYYKIDYSYNDKGLLEKINSSFQDKKMSQINYQYNNRGLRTHYSRSSPKKGEKIKIVTEYNGSLITKQYHYYKNYKKSNNPKYQYTYLFNEDNSKKESNYYFKGKLKYNWHYECNPKGEVENKRHKDTSTVCIRKEIDENGHLVKYVKTTSEKGIITIAKNTYRNDSIIYKSENSKLDGTPISYWENTDSLKTFKSYHKGKFNYQTISEYDNNGNHTKQFFIFHRERWSTTTLYQYDSNGQIIQSREFDFKNELKRKFRYERELY